jgi:hypothetical protein
MARHPLSGWVKDKYDPQDYLHKRKLVRLPDNVALDTFLPPVRDQGQVGSCTGFGIGANIGGTARQLGVFAEWFSPTWLYNGARFIGGTLTQDLGAEPGDVLDWALHNGVLLERDWPYDPERLDKSAPSSERMGLALRYKDFRYFRVTDGAAGIRSALADGHLVSLGSPWYDSWFSPPDSGDLGPADGNVAGGHETCLCGYHLSLERFVGMNSWGDGWGQRGFYLMPFSAMDRFKADGGYDAHYVTFSKEFAAKARGCFVARGIKSLKSRMWDY